MMNETFTICLAILMMWYILFSGNTQFLKADEKPKVDKYIATIYLRIYYGYPETSFVSNWDENGVICYTEQPNTIQQARMEGKWIDVKVICAGGTRDIVLLDFR